MGRNPEAEGTLRTYMILGFALTESLFIFALVVSILSGLLFGLAPALQASRPDLVPTLKGDITMPVGSRRFRPNLRKALVVVQVGISLFALITAYSRRGAIARFRRSVRSASRRRPH